MPLTSTIRQAIALSGGEVEQMGGGCEVLRLPWGDESFIRISSRDDTLVLPETLDGEPVSVGVYWNADDEHSLQEDLCCDFDSLRAALLGTIPGTTVSILQPESARARVALLPSDQPESEDEGCPVGDPSCLSNDDECHDACEPVEQTPTTRANRIEQFLSTTAPYNDEGQTYREAVIDLLADLRHFCDRWTIDIAACDRQAALHHTRETGR